MSSLFEELIANPSILDNEGSSLAKFPALVMAGGLGTRLQMPMAEKPLLKLAGKPLIEYVVSAAEEAEEVERIVVAVSPATPQTRKWAERRGLPVVVTSGRGYAEDLRDAIALANLREPTLVLPCDTPLITVSDLKWVLEEYAKDPCPSLTVAVPLSLLEELGLISQGTFSADVSGEQCLLTGISVVDGAAVLKAKPGEPIPYRLVVCRRPTLAVNINTVQDLKVAEGLLERRSL